MSIKQLFLFRIFYLICLKTPLFISLFMPMAVFAATVLQYEVDFVGCDAHCTEQLKSVSQLLKNADRQAISEAALKRRAELDVSRFIKALHNEGYYDAHVDFSLDMAELLGKITFNVAPGAHYTIGECSVVDFTTNEIIDVDIGIRIGDIAYASDVLDAKENLLLRLAGLGYPHARIEKRNVVADQKAKQILLNFVINKGQFVCFGNMIILGNEKVSSDFIRSKIEWKEGDLYDPHLIERSRLALEATNLFSQVSIALQKELSCTDFQTIEIHVTESMHRTIAAGVGYTTQKGMGTSLEWEHRNIGGSGNRVNASLNLWQKNQATELSYTLPNFGCVDQNFTIKALVDRELTRGYRDTSLKISGNFERKINEKLKVEYGAAYNTIFTSHSTNNGTFNLLKFPLSLRWNEVNSVRDPTSGYTINYKFTPSFHVAHHRFAYAPMTITGTYYRPLTSDDSVVFAAKGLFGTIIGASRRAIPPSELFYAGSDTTLRGYNYMTVSPLNSHYKPTGGKSIAILNLEARFKLNEKVGLVGFYDVGNVYASPVVQFRQKQLQSVGAGIRYETPVGPLRFDVAVPLNKRKHVDSNYQFYMSIGQSF